MTIQAKVLPSPAAYGSTVRISYTGNESVPAVTEVVDQNGNNPVDILIERIEKIHNFSGGNVSVPGGYTFSNGTWDLDEAGGLIIDPPISSGGALDGNDNCLIIVRGKIIWDSSTNHSDYTGKPAP